jgi:hypothetical protein
MLHDGIDIGRGIAANDPRAEMEGTCGRYRILDRVHRGRRIVYCRNRVGRAISDRMMTPERAPWACALLVEREHGDKAAIYVADRIGASGR